MTVKYAIKKAKWVKPLWSGGRWSKYQYGEAWQIDCVTLPQTRQGKRYVLTRVEGTSGWLETYSVPHTTAWDTILGLEKHVLWQHGSAERIELDTELISRIALKTPGFHQEKELSGKARGAQEWRG